MLYIKEEKLKQISLTPNNFYVIMDFDKTISTIDSEDSWTVIQNPKIMNPKLNIESTKLAEKYYPIEMDYTLASSLKSTYMQDWYLKTMNLYYQYGLTYDKLVECVKCGNITLRDGLKELLSYFYENKIPVIILSAGIGNVITQVLDLNACFYDNIHIISNFFSFENNMLMPFNEPILHTCNKKISTLPDHLKKQILDKEHILLFGDFIEDIHMVPKEDLYKTLSFGFLEKNVKANLEFYKNAFDIVLTDNCSFNEVRSILNNIIDKS